MRLTRLFSLLVPLCVIALGCARGYVKEGASEQEFYAAFVACGGRPFDGDWANSWGAEADTERARVNDCMQRSGWEITRDKGRFEPEAEKVRETAAALESAQRREAEELERKIAESRRVAEEQRRQEFDRQERERRKWKPDLAKKYNAQVTAPAALALQSMIAGPDNKVYWTLCAYERRLGDLDVCWEENERGKRVYLGFRTSKATRSDTDLYPKRLIEVVGRWSEMSGYERNNGEAMPLPVLSAMHVGAWTAAPASDEGQKREAESPVRGDVAWKAQAGKGTWYVLVGSFETQANARRVLQHLNVQQVPATVHTSVANKKKVYRVRAGPYPQEVSQRALEDIQRMGFASAQLLDAAIVTAPGATDD
jgi:hypothetical protein